jgi:HEAT repeat protein
VAARIVAAGAARALLSMHEPRAEAALLEVLADPGARMRMRDQERAFFLGVVGDTRVVGQLRTLLISEDAFTRWEAATALARVTARLCGERLLEPGC